jgi:hypothetical protein
MLAVIDESWTRVMPSAHVEAVQQGRGSSAAEDVLGPFF